MNQYAPRGQNEDPEQEQQEVTPTEPVIVPEAEVEIEENEQDDEPVLANEQSVSTDLASRRSIRIQVSSNVTTRAANSNGKKRKKKPSSSSSSSGDEYCGNPPNRQPTNRKFCSICGIALYSTLSTSKLCPKCQNNDVNLQPRLRAKGPASKQRKKWAAVQGWLEDHRPDQTVPSLRTICLEKIAANIVRVESFGGLSELDLERLTMTLCRWRRLDVNVLRLLLAAAGQIWQNEQDCLLEFRLFDCAKLDVEGYQILLEELPQNLHTLVMNYCGKMTDNSMFRMAGKFSQLKQLRLHGAFLIRQDAWKSILNSNRNTLEGLEIEHNPWISDECFDVNLKELKELRLVACPNVSLGVIAKMPPLQRLELINEEGEDGETEFLEDVMENLLIKHGKTLVQLTLNGGGPFEIVDQNLVLLAELAGELQHLSISNTKLSTEQGLVTFFKLHRQYHPSHPGLQSIDWSGNRSLQDLAVDALVAHSGSSLKRINMNGLAMVSEEVWARMAEKIAKNIEELDWSWCRSITDEVIQRLCLLRDSYQWELPAVVRVWGCNRLSDYLQVDQNKIQLVGREQDTLY